MDNFPILTPVSMVVIRDLSLSRIDINFYDIFYILVIIIEELLEALRNVINLFLSLFWFCSMNMVHNYSDGSSPL